MVTTTPQIMSCHYAASAVLRFPVRSISITGKLDLHGESLRDSDFVCREGVQKTSEISRSSAVTSTEVCSLHAIARSFVRDDQQSNAPHSMPLARSVAPRAGEGCTAGGEDSRASVDQTGMDGGRSVSDHCFVSVGGREDWRGAILPMVDMFDSRDLRHGLPETGDHAHASRERVLGSISDLAAREMAEAKGGSVLRHQRPDGRRIAQDQRPFSGRSLSVAVRPVACDDLPSAQLSLQRDSEACGSRAFGRAISSLASNAGELRRESGSGFSAKGLGAFGSKSNPAIPRSSHLGYKPDG